MTQFAKLFEVADTQVLIYMDYRGQDEDSPEHSVLHRITSVNGTRADLKAAYEGEDQERKLKRAFEDFDLAEAKKFLKTVEKLIS